MNNWNRPALAVARMNEELEDTVKERTKDLTRKPGIF